MERLDLRKKFMVLDIETANNNDKETGDETGCPFSYDIGYIIADKYGHIYEKHSFIIRDIFVYERDLMKTAYYGWKIPQYVENLRNGKSEMVDFSFARYTILKDMKKYNVKDVYAYNANFDKGGLDITLRYITKSKYRYFFPYGTNIKCIWHMACQVLFTQKTYQKMALENKWFSPSGNYKTNAEIAYSYIICQKDFQEEHKGLDDVMIEYQILLKCFRHHKKMSTKINRMCWRIPTKKFGKVTEM